MNLLHLEYFYVVARENGFTKASQVLRIQQPAISRMVGQLEDNFGFKLFTRVGRGIQLTPQGQEVFADCQRIFGEVEGLKAKLGRISGQCRGPLMVAAAEPISSHFLPQKIAAIKKQFPEVYPNIFSGPASMLFERLIKGELEMGIFFHIPDLPEPLEIFEELKTVFRLVIRKDLKRDKEIIQSFIGSREIDDVSTRKFPTIERMRREYPQTRIRISSNNLTAHREMVMQGLGVSILPEFLVREDLKSGDLADVLPGEKFEFRMKFIKRKTASLSLNASQFLKFCLN